ncbi:hypothetical protein QEJ31_12890 [Pigmentibacter sp. JX0631]|uniref:hypothetical protein n=1 Tax=Pigmentibacter sp. JX0631 TaxID=2976982 RepID=UPI00246993CA|nr:hypothetical protein [Pigmentibacter sp. JX0631]WGL59420.1 hypothetical protein QEJ31_12890 [Pigmentibacter sp. JX0631]
MEKNLSSEIEHYQKLNAELSKGFELSELKNEFINFWEKWTTIHLAQLKEIIIISYPNTHNFIEIKQLNDQFMHKRTGMISAFLQGIKKKPSLKNEVTLLKHILTEHDEKFTAILTQILTRLLTELNKLNAYRKATNAYLYSQYTLGG